MSKFINKIKSIVGIKTKEVESRVVRTVVSPTEKKEIKKNPKSRHPRNYMQSAKKKRKMQKFSRKANR